METQAKTFRTRTKAIESAREASVIAWDHREPPMPSDAEYHYVARVGRKYVHFPTSMRYPEAEAMFGEKPSIVGVVIGVGEYESFTGK